MGVIGAKGLDADLGELAVAAGLGLLVAELGPLVPDLPRRGRPVLGKGAAHRCGEFWPEGKVRKNEEFKPKDAQDLKLENMLKSMPGEHGTGISIMRPGEYDFEDGKDKTEEIDKLKDEI